MLIEVWQSKSLANVHWRLWLSTNRRHNRQQSVWCPRWPEPDNSSHRRYQTDLASTGNSSRRAFRRPHVEWSWCWQARLLHFCSWSWVHIRRRCLLKVPTREWNELRVSSSSTLQGRLPSTVWRQASNYLVCTQLLSPVREPRLHPGIGRATQRVFQYVWRRPWKHKREEKRQGAWYFLCSFRFNKKVEHHEHRKLIRRLGKEQLSQKQKRRLFHLKLL